MSGKLRDAPLSEIADLNPPLSVSLKDSDDVSFMPMAAVDAESIDAVDRETRRYAEVKKGYTSFQNGDVLVAKITPCFENGKIVQTRLTHSMGFGSTEFHVIRARPERADNRYLVHYLRQDRVRLEGEQRMTGSAGQRRVPESFLADLKIPLPSLSEQRRIADILDKADALRAKRRVALAQLDALAQSIFLDTFGDPASNPKGWEQCSLGELITLGPQNGLYKPADDYGAGTPILRIDAFYDGVVTSIGSLKRVRLSEREISLYRLHESEIVINRVNSPEYLGKSAIVPALGEPTVFESNMMRFDVSRDRLEPDYLIAFLQTRFVRGHINRSAKDAVNQSSINQQDVKAIPLLLPPIKLQRVFRERLTECKNVRLLHEKSSHALDEMFVALQHRAFNGELSPDTASKAA